jgi:uncharacterized protein (UPF0332 family)
MVDSITSRPAIVSREFGIPCVGGINIVVFSKQVRDFDIVCVNGDKGVVSFNSRIKKIREKITKGMTTRTFPPTNGYLNFEKEISKLIIDLNFSDLDKALKKGVKFMQDNFKDYLITNFNDKLNESKSYFFNLCDFFQSKFILLIKNIGYTHSQILSMFQEVDKGSINNDLEKIYSIIKEYSQNMDKYASIENKSIWDF